MSTIASGTDIVVGMELQIARDAFARDLASIKAEFEAFRQSIVSTVIEVPVRLRNEAAGQLTTIMQQLQAQASMGINIPVNVAGGGGGMGGGGPLALAGAAGGGGPGGGGAGNFFNNQQLYNNQQMLAFQQNAFSSTSTTNIYNPANSGGGGGGGGGLGRGIRALSLVHFGREIINDIEAQQAPFDKVRQLGLSGSASQQLRAGEDVAKDLSTGAFNTIADPIRSALYGYSASATVKDFAQQESTISRMEQMRAGQFDLSQSRLQGEVYADQIGGKSAAARKIELEMAKNSALRESAEQFRKASDEGNYAGRIAAARDQYDRASAPEGASSGQGAPSVSYLSSLQASNQQREMFARRDLNTALRSIKAAQDQLAAEKEQRDHNAQGAFDAATAQDARSNRIADLQSDYSAQRTGRQADEALRSASGAQGGTSEILRRYNDELKANIDLLRETAKSEDDVHAKRTRAKADAEDAARATLVSAKRIELLGTPDEQTSSLGAMTSSIRALQMKAAGNSLGAANEESNQSHLQAMNKLGREFNAGTIDERTYAASARSLDASLVSSQIASQQSEALRLLSVRSVIATADTDNPYEQRRIRIRDEFERNSLVDSAHIGDHEAERDAELGQVNRQQSRSETMEKFRNFSAAAITRMRGFGAGRNPQLATATGLLNQEIEELTAHVNDSAEVRGSIREKYRAQADQLLRQTADPQARIALGRIRNRGVMGIGEEHGRPIAGGNAGQPGANREAAADAQFVRAVDKLDKLMDKLMKVLK